MATVPHVLTANRAYFCPGCGAEGDLRFDKRDHPFWYCALCGLRMFIKTLTAEYGFLVLQRFLEKHHVAYREAIIAAETKARRRRLKPPKAVVTI